MHTTIITPSNNNLQCAILFVHMSRRTITTHAAMMASTVQIPNPDKQKTKQHTKKTVERSTPHASPECMWMSLPMDTWKSHK